MVRRPQLQIDVPGQVLVQVNTPLSTALSLGIQSIGTMKKLIQKREIPNIFPLRLLLLTMRNE